METSSRSLCHVDEIFKIVGFQGGEADTCLLRTACTFITVSIISSWIGRREDISRLLLFWWHWMSGLVHQLSQLLLSNLVLLCWSTTELLWVIKALKFVELAGSNMLAITNVAICFNLAQVVASHRTLSRVKSATSPRLMWSFVALAVLLAVPVVPFWDRVAVSGTLYWMYNRDPTENDWILISTFYVELIAGVIMSIIVLWLIAFRRPELRQVWRVHRRVRFYMALSVIAIVVDLGVGIGGILYIIGRDPLYTSVSWTTRHIHIALDTLVLYSALGVTSDRSEGGHFKAAAVSGGNAAGNSDHSAASAAASAAASVPASVAAASVAAASATASTAATAAGRPGIGGGDDVFASGSSHRRSRSGGYHVTKPAVELARDGKWDGDSPPANNRYSYCRYKSTAIPLASV